jgi:hypothetical protein
MNEAVEIFYPDFNELRLSEENLVNALGYKGIETPTYIKPLIYKSISEIKNHLNIECGYRLIDSDDFDITSTRMICKQVDFVFHPIIGTHLKGAEQIAIFVSTLGIAFDNWSKEISDQNNYLEAFVIDTIGAELVENTADWLENKIFETSIKNGKRISNRLSPGYCNWNVNDQHKLFALLPEKFCGISLNKSAMMNPKKSISGVIGIGENVKRLDYQCNICDLETCYKRR